MDEVCRQIQVVESHHIQFNAGSSDEKQTTITKYDRPHDEEPVVMELKLFRVECSPNESGFERDLQVDLERTSNYTPEPVQRVESKIPKTRNELFSPDTWKWLTIPACTVPPLHQFGMYDEITGLPTSGAVSYIHLPELRPYALDRAGTYVLHTRDAKFYVRSPVNPSWPSIEQPNLEGLAFGEIVPSTLSDAISQALQASTGANAAVQGSSGVPQIMDGSVSSPLIPHHLTHISELYRLAVNDPDDGFWRGIWNFYWQFSWTRRTLVNNDNAGHIVRQYILKYGPLPQEPQDITKPFEEGSILFVTRYWYLLKTMSIIPGLRKRRQTAPTWMYAMCWMQLRQLHNDLTVLIISNKCIDRLLEVIGAIELGVFPERSIAFLPYENPDDKVTQQGWIDWLTLRGFTINDKRRYLPYITQVRNHIPALRDIAHGVPHLPNPQMISIY